MPTWSTDHLPWRDRFEYWREERARRMFGVDAEIASDWRPRFTGRISGRAVGPARVIDVAVTTYTMRRTERAIDRSPDASFYIRYLVGGRGVTLVGDRADRVVPGTISTGMSDVPYTNMPDPQMPTPGDLCVYRAIRIPLSALPDLPTASRRLASQQHRGTSGLDALLRTYLATFLEQMPHLSGEAAEQAVRTLAQLALAARGATETRDEPGTAAIREGLLARARHLIERDLHRTDLTPAHVAAELGVSLRKLHLVFEPSGESVGRHLLARRLARSDRLLREAPHMSVTEIAYASGFEALSTFFRGYRAAFGASPGERRAAPAAENGPDAPARPHPLRA
jgi:AraC-like DNA-binding protein